MQRQLRELQEKIGFRYLGFHGLFDDDMLVYAEREDGSARLDFSLADQLFDFLLEIGLRPYIELGFTPSPLAADQGAGRQLRRGSNLCVPNDLDRWMDIVHAFIQHAEARYGAREVREWYFSVMSIHCAVNNGRQAEGQFEAYCDMYRRTFRLMKRAGYRLTGPGLYSNALHEAYFARFLRMCAAEDCVPDQYTFLCFPYEPISDQDFFRKLSENGAFPDALSEDERYVEHFAQQFDELRKSLGLPEREVTLTEWNATMWQRDLCNDCCFKAAYLAKNIAENDGAFWGMGYWTVNDMQEETAPGEGLFYGGYGLHTVQGVEKAAFHALCLLDKIDGRIIARGEGCLLARGEYEAQILLYNYCHYDSLYRNHYLGDTRAAGCYDRFVDKEDLCFLIQLTGAAPGPHRVRRWAVNRLHGSAFDAWIEMGAPARLDKEEIGLLRGLAGPQYRVDTVRAETTLQLTARLRPHEVQLITIAL